MFKPCTNPTLNYSYLVYDGATAAAAAAVVCICVCVRVLSWYFILHFTHTLFFFFRRGIFNTAVQHALPYMQRMTGLRCKKKENGRCVGFRFAGGAGLMITEQRRKLMSVQLPLSQCSSITEYRTNLLLSLVASLV